MLCAFACLRTLCFIAHSKQSEKLEIPPQTNQKRAIIWLYNDVEVQSKHRKETENSATSFHCCIVFFPVAIFDSKASTIYYMWKDNCQYLALVEHLKTNHI